MQWHYIQNTLHASRNREALCQEEMEPVLEVEGHKPVEVEAKAEAEEDWAVKRLLVRVGNVYVQNAATRSHIKGVFRVHRSTVHHVVRQ